MFFLQKKMDLGLITAAREGNLPLIRDLINRGPGEAGIHAQIDRALIAAATNGKLSVVRELLDRGANIHTQNDSPLTQAARYGHVFVVRELLDRGPPNYVHAQNDRALFGAAQNGYSDVIQELLNRGADINRLSSELQAEYHHLVPKFIAPNEYYLLESSIEGIENSSSDRWILRTDHIWYTLNR